MDEKHPRNRPHPPQSRLRNNSAARLRNQRGRAAQPPSAKLPSPRQGVPKGTHLFILATAIETVADIRYDGNPTTLQFTAGWIRARKSDQVNPRR
jgi:hypothetical protein